MKAKCGNKVAKIFLMKEHLREISLYMLFPEISYQ